jgi:hypothetical protein
VSLRAKTACCCIAAGFAVAGYLGAIPGDAATPIRVVPTPAGAVGTPLSAEPTAPGAGKPVTVVVEQTDHSPGWANVVSAFAWPLFLACVIAFFLISRKGRFFADTLVGRVNRVGALGLLELDFSRDRAADVKRALEFMFKDYRRQAVVEFNKLARRHRVAKLRDKLAKETIEGLLNDEGRKSYRCTIYVKDLVFEEGLYQLLDYYPRGGGRGRIIPRRYGLVGRAFRAENSLTQPAVPGDVDRLVIDWGMTREEAARKNDRHSFSCVLLREAGTTVGGIYVDSVAEDAFTDCKTFAATVEQAAESIGLLDAMSSVTAEIDKRGASITFLAQAAK